MNLNILDWEHLCKSNVLKVLINIHFRNSDLILGSIHILVGNFIWKGAVFELWMEYMFLDPIKSLIWSLNILCWFNNWDLIKLIKGWVSGNHFQFSCLSCIVYWSLPMENIHAEKWYIIVWLISLFISYLDLLLQYRSVIQLNVHAL